MKKIILELTLDGPIPAVTKQDIAEQSAEKLKNLDFKYSVQPEKEAIDIHNELVSGVISAVNEEPISATLETVGDIDKAITEATHFVLYPNISNIGNKISRIIAGANNIPGTL